MSVLKIHSSYFSFKVNRKTFRTVELDTDKDFRALFKIVWRIHKHDALDQVGLIRVSEVMINIRIRG